MNHIFDESEAPIGKALKGEVVFHKKFSYKNGRANQTLPAGVSSKKIILK